MEETVKSINKLKEDIYDVNTGDPSVTAHLTKIINNDGIHNKVKESLILIQSTHKAEMSILRNNHKEHIGRTLDITKDIVNKVSGISNDNELYMKLTSSKMTFKKVLTLLSFAVGVYFSVVAINHTLPDASKEVNHIVTDVVNVFFSKNKGGK